MGLSRQRVETAILAMLRKQGVLRPRELLAAGLATAPLTKLVRGGQVHRVGRGLYALPEADHTEHRSLVEAAVRVPKGVVCLLSALQFHDLGSQVPHEVWLAIAPKARLPKQDQPRLHVARFSGPAMTTGVEAHLIEGVTVKVFSAAKTVVDCFRYRHKLGLDVALEALRDHLAQGGSPDELWRIAKACRMARVMQPYLEASL